MPSVLSGALAVLVELAPAFVRDASTIQFVIAAAVDITTTTDTYTTDWSCFRLALTDFSIGHRVCLSLFSYHFELRKWQPANEAIKVNESAIKG